MRLSGVLGAALLLAVASALAFAKTGPAVSSRLSGPSERHTRPRTAADRRASGRPSPYWRLERRYVRQQRAYAHQIRALRRRVRALRGARTLQAERSTEATIRLVFWNRGDEAVRVSSCETGGTFSTSAENGTHLGIFQMGQWERNTYGHGSTVLEQALAAYRYFLDTGRDWSPWECKP